MFDRMKTLGPLLLLALSVLLHGGSAANAQDALWHVSKSSGEVWLTATGAQTVSLSSEASLKPGDNIRTGRNGRVLLARGEETILISPNSAIGIPAQAKEGLSTTIMQQAGSIVLEVEKRNVQHFEVETPYLAAVVKGTQFRVSVSNKDASVDVLRGEVEVADLKSGQFALVLPGQSAKVLAHGPGGLSLSGTGTLNPIQKGEPRAPTVNPVLVPKAGLSAPGVTAKPQQLRIASPLGDVHLNFQKVTNGLAHAATLSGAGGKAAKETVWSSAATSPGNSGGGAGGQGSDTAGGNGNGSGNGNGNGNGGANGNSASAGGLGYGLGQSKGNNGNGNGNGNNGNGNGNNGNGNNGNGNNGNGNNGNNGNGHHH
jgi:hypothetical protein